MEKIKNLINNVGEKVSQTFNHIKQINLNPINIFIKDSLDKIFNDLTLGHQIKLEDIRNGCVTLQNLQLNALKINKQHLLSSPYILHNGTISGLRIRLPSLKQLQKTSITIQIEDIFLSLKPQSNFAQNFKNIIQEIKQYIRLNGNEDEEGEDSTACEHDPRDYFKKLIKTMFRNLKIKVKNIVILVYLEDPDKTIQKNSMLMLRIPLINMHRGGQMQIGKQIQNHKLETVNFDIQLPQLTLHLLHQQVQERHKNFPFIEPSTSHPGTILLFGKQNFLQSEVEQDQQVPRARIEMKTDYEKGEIDYKIQINAPKIQAMINPQQVKMLLFFVAQVKHFGEQLQKVRKQLGLGQSGQNEQTEETVPVLLSRRSSNRKLNEDIFGSICMSFWAETGSFIIPQGNQGGHRSKRRSPDMIDTIINEHPQLEIEVQQLNKQIQQSMVFHSIQLQNEQLVQEQHVVAICFKNYVTFNMKLGFAKLYIVNHIGSEHGKRSWIDTSNLTDQQINCEIKQSYFLISISGTNFAFIQREKQLEIELAEAIIKHVKYRGKKKQLKKDNQNINIHQQNALKIQISEDKEVLDKKQNVNLSMSQYLYFYNVQDSMDYYLQTHQKQVQNEKHEQQQQNQEQLNQGEQRQIESQHHCAQNILRISHKVSSLNSHSKETSNKIYSFCPDVFSQEKQNEQHIQLYEPGMFIRKKESEKQKKLAVKLMHVQICISTQIGLQICQFGALVKEILDSNNKNNQKQSKQTNQNPTQTANNTQNNEQQNHQIKSSSPKSSHTSFQLTTKLICIAFYQCPFQNFKTSVQKYNLSQHDDFQSACFCSLNSKAIYLIVNDLILHTEPQIIKMTLKYLNLGLANICQSKIESTHTVLSINEYINIENNKRQKLKFAYQTSKKHKPKASRLIISFPQTHINILENSIIQSLRLIKRQSTIFMPIIDKIFSSSNDQEMKLKQPKNSLKNKQTSNNHLKLQFSLARISLLDLQLYLNNFCIQKTFEQLLIHVSTIVLSSTVPTNIYQTVMNNSRIPSYVELKQKQQNNIKSRYPQINDSMILLQVNNPEYCPKVIKKQQNKILLKKQQKNSIHQSDQITLQRQSCLVINFRKQKQLNNSSDKQIISVTISSPIFLNAVNLLKVHKFDKYIEQFDKIKSLVQSIKNNKSLDINQQQQILQKPQQKLQPKKPMNSTISQQYTISGGKIFIDIQPTFIPILPKQSQKKVQQVKNAKVLSNTRSILLLGWDDMKINTFSNNKLKIQSTSLTIKYYFAKLKQQNHNNANKYLYKSLAQLLKKSQQILEGKELFNKILQVTKIKLEIQRVAHLIKPKVTIDNIKTQSTFYNLSWLLLHWDQFIKHDLNQNYGITTEESQNIIQNLIWEQNSQQNNQQANDDDQQQIEDITNADEKYNQKIKHKKQIEENFIKRKPFNQPQSDNKCSLFVQNLSIQQISIKLFYTQNSYLQTYLQGIKIVLKESAQTKKTQLFLKAEEFEVNHFQKYQQSEGIVGMFVNFWYKTEDEFFQIFKSNNLIKLFLEVDEKNTMLKSEKVGLQVGFTSQLLKIIDQWDKIQQQVNCSGWKKLYEQKKHQQQRTSQRLLLMHGPQTNLNLTLIYEGINILSSKRLDTPLFLLHQQTHQLEKIKKYVVNWVESLIKDNIRGLIASTALDSFGSLVKQLLRLVKELISMFLRCFG